MKESPEHRDLEFGMLRLLRIERLKDRCTAEELETACRRYYSRYSGRLSCFDELRDVVDVLDVSQRQSLISFAEEHAKERSESSASSPTARSLNALKLEYCFSISAAISVGGGQEFACKAISSYQSCFLDGESGALIAPMAMLACMAVLQASQEGVKGDAHLHLTRLQAGILLRHCLARSRDDYATLVVLTLLSRLLGAISLSATLFEKLSIRNLQWENTGHLLLSRLSTLHPHGSNTSEGRFDPLQMLDIATAANLRSVKSVRSHVMAGLDQKSYVNVMETIEFKEGLKQSFARHLYNVEHARIRRLRDLADLERAPLPAGKTPHRHSRLDAV